MDKSRITINLDKDLEKKLRVLQASLITSTNGTYSFSKVIEFTLTAGLEKLSKKKSLNFN